MKRLLATSPCRALVAALTMASWFVLSNHCALGLMAALPMSAEHAGCCGQSCQEPDGNPSTTPVRECCQSMRAISPAVMVAVVPAQIDGVLAAWFGPAAVPQVALAHDATLCILETGPPEARSFAELVLRHGVRTHAPPVVAPS